MIVDENDAPLVRQIFKEVSKGVESADAIRKRLCPNIPRTSFMQMLHNILYIGKIRVPALEEEPEQIVDGEHEPLIDEETFYRVQDLIEGRNRRKHTLVKGKKPHPDFYLRKYVICPMCGRPITASFSKGNGGKYPYYHCMGGHRHYNIRAEKMNGEFVRYISGLKPRKEVLDLYNEVLRSLREDGCVNQKKYLKELESSIESLEKRKKRISNDYMDEKIDAKMFTELKQSVEDEIHRVKNQIEGVQAAIRTNLSPKLNYSISLIDNLDRYFEDAPIEVKQRLLGSIFPEKVEFDGKSFRTNKYNAVLDLIYNETKQLRTIKKDLPTDKSVPVAGEGIEPPTFGL
ncbi:MAG: recombinase family protein [Bacteroidales bacterium]|nr:recombinase family protein [Bacteroidales bacterium]